MRFGSVCSGIEAASVAWEPLGWKAAWLAEIEPFPSAVLKHHYPEVPNLGDMTTLPDRILAGEVEAPDLFCGGTPCQAFSVAGLRQSLADARGNLSLVFVEIADAIDHVRRAGGKPPAIVFWENVPGVLSTADNAFGCFLGALAGCDSAVVPGGGRWTDAGVVAGPKRTVAWRILDAQFFGLAQRRRRVFVVASARDGFDPAAVLLEFDGLRRDSAPSREKGEGVAPTVMAGAPNGGPGHGARSGHTKDNLIVPVAFGGGQNCAQTDVSTALHAHPGGSRLDFQTETFITHTLRGEGFDAREDGTGRGTPLVPVGVTLHGTDGTQSVASLTDISSSLRAQPVAIRTAQTSSNGWGINTEGTAYTLDQAQGQAIAQPVPFDTTQITSAANYSNPKPGDPCHPLAAGAHAPAVAFHPTHDPISSPEVCHAIGTGSGGGDKPHVLCETLYNKGFNRRGLYASTQETNAGKILRTLREAVGEEAFAQWGLGILGSLQSPEILRQALHGVSVRPATFSRSWVVHCALSRSENGSGWLLQSLRETGCEGCPPQGWEPSEQLVRQLGAYLSELSQPGAQASRFVRDLWWAAQGPGVLREALSAIQEVGRPTNGQGQPAHGGMQVRRLTVEECEFLQGFPRSYTAIPWRGKPADQCPDGPRYKALGNSWAVPCVRWIGQRIQKALA